MNKMIIIGVVLAVLVALWLSRRSGKPVKGCKGSKTTGPLTIYGTMGCGWTKKQLKHCDEKKIPYKFVDCDSESCPEFVKGYPTMDKGGEIIEGYREF
jgi:hypothetical protein